MRALIWFFLVPLTAYSQNSIDLDAAVGRKQVTLAAAFTHDWSFGGRDKSIAGVGGRATSYFGRNQYYVTAPAELTSGRTGPLVLFTDNILANMDSFRVARPNVFMFNAYLNLGYRFTEKLLVGFNIDALGFSVGRPVTGTYINGPQTNVASAKVTSFNALLVSDNDLGSLDSELYARYLLRARLYLRGGVQFLFTEYTTASQVQQFPEPNDRFRKKTLMFMIGAGLIID